MKKISLTLIALLIIVLTVGCNGSKEEDFKNQNEAKVEDLNGDKPADTYDEKKIVLSDDKAYESYIEQVLDTFAPYFFQYSLDFSNKHIYSSPEEYMEDFIDDFKPTAEKALEGVTSVMVNHDEIMEIHNSYIESWKLYVEATVMQSKEYKAGRNNILDKAVVLYEESHELKEMHESMLKNFAKERGFEYIPLDFRAEQ
ncbi:hypothetical protein PRVXH_000316 [Proteinivorax hydrogeniformans]|uniref:Lipoprotein n=1 Tax=Proteinivorax hydrogeniformans TaxID=1826727 RepID=A0AAU8HUF6_9FIRM